MHDDWHRNAVIYQIDPSLFRDSNGDGRGDLRGIADFVHLMERAEELHWSTCCATAMKPPAHG